MKTKAPLHIAGQEPEWLGDIEKTIKFAKEFGYVDPVEWFETGIYDPYEPEPPYQQPLWLKWREHMESNKIFMSKGSCYSFSTQQDQHIDRPVVIVGSGPSLEDNIDEINELIKDPKYVVIAVNSAVYFLDRVDYYCFSERDFDIITKWNFEKDPKCVNPEAQCLNMVTYPFVDREVIPRIGWTNLLMVNQARENGLPKLFRGWWDVSKPHYLNMPLELFELRETAQLALIVAYWIGCKEWILCGMDYSFTDKYYAFLDPNCGYISDISRDFEHSATRQVKLTDMYGKEVLTSPRMELNRNRLAIQAAFYRKAGIHITQCTEGGIFYKGIDKVMTVKEYREGK